ncbi:hypothetical protein CRUP_004612 [Coryphaenoides rupestris]|nr:hypothetical protein CRUP_004612 [Coryphaenoides rupestris]
MATSDLHSKESSRTAGSFRKRKARFTFSEVHIMLDEVKKHRHILSVPGDLRKRTWSQVTAAINEIGECKREVLDVVKKWSDLKCDTRRKLLAMRTDTLPERKVAARGARDLTPTERIVHEILQMDNTPWEDGAPLDDEDEEDWISPMEEEEEEEEEDDEDDEDEWTPERPWIRPSSTFAMRKRKFRRLRDDPAAGAAASAEAGSSSRTSSSRTSSKQAAAASPAAAPIARPVVPPGPPRRRCVLLLANAALSCRERTGTCSWRPCRAPGAAGRVAAVQLAESQAVSSRRQSLQAEREIPSTPAQFATGAVALITTKTVTT